MSKCKILLDCLSNFVGQNISPDLGQNNGRPSRQATYGPCSGKRIPSEIRKYTALQKADTKLDSRCWWLDIKAEITGSVLQCLVGGTISTFVSNLYTFGSLMVSCEPVHMCFHAGIL